MLSGARWASATVPPLGVPARPSCPLVWALGSPLCAGTQVQGPGLGTLFPRVSHLGADTSCLTVSWGSRSPSLVSRACGEPAFQGPKTSEKVGEPQVPCLPGVESGKQARLAQPQQQTGWGGALHPPGLPNRLAPSLARAPGHPSPLASPGCPVLQLLVIHWGAGRLPPPSRPGHRVRHLPLSQEAPGPVLGGPASREAWLVICVATWPPRAAPAGAGPGYLLEAGPGLGTGGQHSTPGWPTGASGCGEVPRRRGGAEGCSLPL